MNELFLSVLNMSLTASYVILFVIVIRILLKKAPKFISYALWAVVAFRLIIPFSFESMFSLLPRSTNAVLIPHNIIYQQSPQIHSGIEAVDSFVSESLPAPTIEASIDSSQIYIEIGAYIWVVGIVALILYSLISVLLIKKQLKCAKLIEQNVYEAENLNTPFVLGLIRPKVYLPVGLNTTERSYILLHEQTHIHRKDHMIKVFAFLTLSIHWFNPFVWIAFMLMSGDMELSCDERVLKEMSKDVKKLYANSLLSLATRKHILNGSPLAFGEGNVKGRIKNVLNYKKPRFWVMVLAIFMVTAVGIGLLTNPENKNAIEVNDSSDGPMKHIQVEITQPGNGVLTGIVITDKDGYKAGKPVTVAIGEKVSYDVASLVVGDWIDIDYRMVREKEPPEFVAVHISRIIGGNYPTTFMLIENGDIVQSNILRNSRVASEMPALLLSGSPDSSLRINGVPDSPRYLIIDIGSTGDKIYYTFEKDGKYYAGHDDMHEITRQTFDALMQYVNKNEIAVQQVSGSTTLKPDEIFGTLPYAQDDMMDTLFDNDSSFEEWELIGLVDMNRDNQEESIYLDKSQINDGLVMLRIIDISGIELWNEQFSTAHAGWNQLFLCELDGKQYLLRYNPTMYQGYCTYVYTLFTPENGKETVIRTNELEFDINGTKELDAPQMVAFSDEVNELLSKSSLLISSNGGDFSFGLSSAEQFFERFSWLDEYKMLFSDEDSLETKLNKFSEYAVSN